MGFLKMGISLMSLFLFIIFAASFLHLGELVTINFIVWFYSFFHVHNLASLPDEEFYAVEDNYLFHFENSALNGQNFFHNNRRAIAAVTIVLGVIMTWRSLLDFIRALLPWHIYDYITTFTYRLPRIITGAAIIALGILMIRGKKKELEMDFDTEDYPHPSTPSDSREEMEHGKE